MIRWRIKLTASCSVLSLINLVSEVGMADTKPPKLVLGEDKPSSIRIWTRKFNAWATLQNEWRDLAKDSKTPDHWVEKKSSKGNRGIPAGITRRCTHAIWQLYGPDVSGWSKSPWLYQEKLKELFTGQDNIMPQRLEFLNCIQKPHESILEFENRVRNIARETRYDQMADPLQELMRDRFSTGVGNEDLRQTLLHHFKEDGKTPYTFADNLAKAKAWEPAHKTNITIKHSIKATDEQVNQYQTSSQQKFPKPATSACGWCGGPRHPKKECPANNPKSYCSNCGMTGNHYTKVCRSSRDKYKQERDRDRAGKSWQHNRRQPKQVHIFWRLAWWWKWLCCPRLHSIQHEQ